MMIRELKHNGGAIKAIKDLKMRSNSKIFRPNCFNIMSNERWILALMLTHYINIRKFAILICLYCQNFCRMH